MSEKLKPCPFCGQEPRIDTFLHVVFCGNSDCEVRPETSWFDTTEEAITAWQCRAMNEDYISTRIEQQAFEIAQCEMCGEVFDRDSREANDGEHVGISRDAASNPEPIQCGPISLRPVIGVAEALALLDPQKEAE